MRIDVNEESLLKNVEVLLDEVSKHISEPNKSVLLEALGGPFGELYLMAPASGNKKYHLPVTGGLAAHSLNVLGTLRTLNEAFQTGFSEEDMVICAICHDISKACSPDMNTPHYLPNDNQWRKDNLGELYMKDYSKGFLTNRDRNFFVLQQLGLKLTFEQFQAVFIADGFFGEQNKGYQRGGDMDCCKLALFVHFADFISAIQERG